MISQNQCHFTLVELVGILNVFFSSVRVMMLKYVLSGKNKEEVNNALPMDTTFKAFIYYSVNISRPIDGTEYSELPHTGDDSNSVNKSQTL